MRKDRNCQSCKYYKDGYCENLELKPCYPQKGCDDFENKRMSNKKWIDFLCEQFDISRTSARDMLHVMMSIKKEDNFKKQFSQQSRGIVKPEAESEE